VARALSHVICFGQHGCIVCPLARYAQWSSEYYQAELCQEGASTKKALMMRALDKVTDELCGDLSVGAHTLSHTRDRWRTRQEGVGGLSTPTERVRNREEERGQRGSVY
jgi:hypothetical protein